MGSWLSQFVQQSSYLQLYWTLQTGHVTLLTAYRLATRNWPHAAEVDPADRSLGWLEFRKRTTQSYMIGCVCSFYLLWTVFRAYCFDVTPSARFQYVFDAISTPSNANVDVWCTYVGLSLYSLHIARRLYECLYTCIFSRHRTVGPLTFITDLLFYVAAALSLVAESPRLVGQADWLGAWSSALWYQVPAVAACAWAAKVQNETFYQLQKMRRNRAGHIVTTGYKVPRGGWFDRLNVASPHYLAEVVFHLAVGVALGGRSATWWMLTAYVTLDHVHLAYDKMAFYRAKFAEDFPKERKMLVPGVL